MKYPAMTSVNSLSFLEMLESLGIKGVRRPTAKPGQLGPFYCLVGNCWPFIVISRSLFSGDVLRTIERQFRPANETDRRYAYPISLGSAGFPGRRWRLFPRICS